MKTIEDELIARHVRAALSARTRRDNAALRDAAAAANVKWEVLRATRRDAGDIVGMNHAAEAGLRVLQGIDAAREALRKARRK